MFNLKFAGAIGLVFTAILSLSLFLIVPSKANTVNTSWRVNFVPPLTRQNGEPLLPEEIKWIACNYKGMGSTDWTWGKNTTEQGQTYVDLVDLMLEPGDYEIACLTLDTNDLKSVYSVPIIMTVVAPAHFPPSAPTDVTAREL